MLRRVSLAAGLGGLVAHATSLVLGPSVVDWHRHQTLGTVLAHASAGLTALGLAAPAAAVLRRQALHPRRLALGPWLVLGATAAGLALLVRLAPGIAREVITREWGLVEPLQFVAYGTAAGLAFAHARLRGLEGGPRAVYLTAGVWASVQALEEVDYLGALSTLAALAGAPRGRVRGRHLGGFHDLVNIAWGEGAVGLTVLAATLLGVAALAAWRFGPALSRWVRALAHEIRPGDAALLGVNVTLLTLAQLNDVDDRIFAGTGLPTGKLVEEPAELVAALALVSWQAQALARTWAAGPLTPARPGRTASGTGRRP
ncbi:MAG TPA: hypothetical protein VNK50_12755 [Calidithermus sp.]|nr:hypothetical protein [Calidithermus sp.]